MSLSHFYQQFLNPHYALWQDLLMHCIKPNPPAYLPYKMVKSLLKAHYGERYYQKIVKHHGLNEAQMIKENKIGLNDFKVLLIGCAAHIKPFHLKRLYLEYIRHNNLHHLDGFDELTEEDHRRLLQYYRPPQLLLAILAPGFVARQKLNKKQLEDYRTVRNLSMSIYYYHKKHQAHAVTELMAHKYAYKTLDDGVVLPIYNRPFEVTHLEVLKTISPSKINAPRNLPGMEDALKFVVAKEVVTTDDTKMINLHIMSPGVHNIGGVRRAGEPISPGHYSYLYYESDIIKELTEVIQKQQFRLPIHLHIHGHSLGSADAQRLSSTITSTLAAMQDKSGLKHLRAWQQYDANLQDYDALKGIQEMTLNLWSPTGIHHDDNARFLESEQKLNGGLVPQIRFNINTHQVEMDLTRYVGESVLGNTHQSPYIRRKHMHISPSGLPRFYPHRLISMHRQNVFNNLESNALHVEEYDERDESFRSVDNFTRKFYEKKYAERITSQRRSTGLTWLFSKWLLGGLGQNREYYNTVEALHRSSAVQRP